MHNFIRLLFLMWYMCEIRILLCKYDITEYTVLNIIHIEYNLNLKGSKLFKINKILTERNEFYI